MIPLRARYSKIEKIVDDILKQAEVTTPPIPVDRLVRARGVTIRMGDLGDVSGLLVKKEAEVIIGVNQSHVPTRRRFTIAHEFGHYILHQDITSHVDRDYKVHYRSRLSSEATDIEEIEANFFAACLLMPKKFLDAENALDALDSDASVKVLARKFEVSPHAMSLRLANVYRIHRPF